MAFVDPEAGTRASGILALAYRQHLPIRAKETCFGLMLEGERDVIRDFLGRLRDSVPVRALPEAPAVFHRRHEGLRPHL